MILAFFVKADLEDTPLTPVEPSVDNNMTDTTTLPDIQQPIDIESPKEISQEEQDSALPQDTDQIIPIEKDVPQETDILNGLQPNLPGPKPEESGIDNPPGIEQGENWEKTCEGDLCRATIYSYQKYSQHNGQWRQIDEAFYSTPCQNGYDFCVTNNLYQMQMRSYPDTTNAMLFTFNGVDFKFTPYALTFAANTGRQNIGSIQRSPAQVTNNRAHYPSAFTNNFDLQFTYLPRMFKEDLIIKTKERLPLANLSQNSREITFNVEFTLDVTSSTQIFIDHQAWDKQTELTTRQPIEIKQGSTSFYLAQPLAYDARGATIPLSYTVENRQNILFITLKTPYDWLMNETREYPVTIDPTLSLDYTSIIWDGYVTYNTEPACPAPPDPCNNPSRNGVSSLIFVGNLNNTPAPGVTTYRGDLDWDISVIPDLAQIEDVQLHLYFETTPTSNDEMRFLHMAGGDSHYPNTDAGNTDFYNDLNDGTEYLRQQATAGQINQFNLTASSQVKTDLQTFLVNGTDTWSMGIRSEEPNKVLYPFPSNFTSAEGTLANRPSLDITYKAFATESEGDAAILQGVTNALGTPDSVATTQQVYVYNSIGSHQAGFFDIVTSNLSKRWLVSYITFGEEFLNVQNMSTAIYSLELQNLTVSQITTQVQDLIQGTV